MSDNNINKSKKSCVSIVGFIVLIIGVLLLVLPGPGIIVIAIGLAILALEYEWAKKYFDKLEGLIKKLFKK